MRKSIFPILFLSLNLTSCVVEKMLSEEKMRDREAREISYLINCIKRKCKADSLIEWELGGPYINYENSITYVYDNINTSFFDSYETENGRVLRSIIFFHRNYQKIIFLDETISKCKIDGNTRFGVWMSGDRRSIYFCMVKSDEGMIWVLTNLGAVSAFNFQL